MCTTSGPIEVAYPPYANEGDSIVHEVKSPSAFLRNDLEIFAADISESWVATSSKSRKCDVCDDQCLAINCTTQISGNVSRV